MEKPVYSAAGTRAPGCCWRISLKREKQHSREFVAYQFWPDSVDTQARTNLRRILYALRKQAPRVAAYVHDEDGYLSWRTDLPQAIDAAAFESALQRASEMNVSPADRVIEALVEAVNVYHGDLLPGHYDDWVLTERQRLHTAYVDSLFWLIELLEKAGRYQDAIFYAEILLHADGLRETTYLILMRLYAAQGDRARALAVYAECRRKLVNELGVEPGFAVEELHRQLLVAMDDRGPAAAERHRGPSFVGRAHEWSQLVQSWHRADAGSAQVVFVTGEAGIGKTRLVQEFLAWCEARWAASRSTAYCPQAQEPLGYVGMASWLSSAKLAARLNQLGADELGLLITLVPALRRHKPHIVPTPLSNDAWQRLQLYQAADSLLLAEDETTVLFLDDAQWCDRQSLDWLQYVMAAHPQARLLVIFGLGSGGNEAQPLTLAKTGLMMRGRLMQIHLSRLAEAETSMLAHATAFNTLPERVMERVRAASNGNPFFVVELVRMLDTMPAADGAAGNENGNMASTLPGSISALVTYHLAFLSQPARQVLDVAAVIWKDLQRNFACRGGQLDKRITHCCT